MKNPAELLKTAADLLDSQEVKLAEQAAKITELTAKVASAEKPAPKVASVDLVAQAKTAADLLVEKGLLSSTAMRDSFAAKIASSHDVAIAELARLAGIYKKANEVQRLGEPDESAPVAPKEDPWAARFAQYNATGK